MIPAASLRRHLLTWALWATLSAVSLLLVASQARTVLAFEPWWVQSHTTTQLWSGPDARAVSFGPAPQWSHFLVVAPQQGARLHVMDPRTGNYAFVDARAVGPSSAPTTPAAPEQAPTPGPQQEPAPTPALPAGGQPLRSIPQISSGYEPWWVANFREAELWSGPDSRAASLGKVPQFRRFLVVEPQSGNRLKVWNPEQDSFGYLDASIVGPSGPSIWVDVHQAKVTRQVSLPARSVGNKSYIRNLPVFDDETELRYAPHNSPLDVKEAVETANGSQWYRLADGGFIRASEVRLPRPADKPMQGRWIDADLQEPVMVTAYEGDRPVYAGLAVKGVSAFSTPRGTFVIQRRVQNETMDSETLIPPIPRDAPGGYLLKDVLYTQYFTGDGASIHYNYWLVSFGYAGSHGCLGMNLEDSKFFWDWANIGTPVVIR